MSDETQEPGEIITFYSYKGGTGRTLALANVACLLARRNPKDRILIIDWDLEAPGLHRYFRDHVTINPLASFNREEALNKKEGLLEFFVEIDKRSGQKTFAGGDEAAREVKTIYDGLPFEQFTLQTDIEGLELMKAGRFDAEYSNRVNSFDWSKLFSRSEWLIRLFADELKQRYRYILIDSRTGITDTSGICTTLLPDKLVVVFTPNRQSLTGIRDLVKSATDYRRCSPDVRPLLVFPLVSRVEVSKPSLQKLWRVSPIGSDVTGYQPMFEDLFRQVYGLENGSLQQYFDEIQIQQVADYAYGEEIAALTDFSKDRFSLTTSFQALCNRLEGAAPPWEEPDEQVANPRVSLFEVYKRRIIRPAFAFLRRYPLVSLIAAVFCLASLWAVQRSTRTSGSDPQVPHLNAVIAALTATNLNFRASALDSELKIRVLTNELGTARVRAAAAEQAAANAESNTVSFTTKVVYFSNSLAVASRLNTSLLSSNMTLQESLQDTLVGQTNLLSRVSEAEARAYDLQRQLDPILAAQEGWTNVLQSSLVKLSAATGRAPPLTINTNIYLWATAIEPKLVTVVVKSTPPSSGESGSDIPTGEGGIQYLSASLSYGASTNFTVADFDYKITLEDILYSVSDNSQSKFNGGMQNAASGDLGRSSAAVFSVYFRSKRRPRPLPPQIISVKPVD